MSLSPNVAQLQREHVSLELECIDRMYLNAYVPLLTSESGIAWYFRGHLGHRFASTKEAGPMTERFLVRIGRFQREEDLELVRFQKGQRKDDIFKDRLKKFQGTEGVVFIGVAQEKARVPRTIRKQFQGGTIPWIDYTTAMVNFYYFYCVDAEFGWCFCRTKPASRPTLTAVLGGWHWVHARKRQHFPRNPGEEQFSPDGPNGAAQGREPTSTHRRI